MKKKYYLFSLILLLAGFLASNFNLFYAADRYLMDSLYQRQSRPSADIRIIAIDEKTLDAYGPYASWSREKSARLVSLLNKDKESMPAVIGFDIMFIGESGGDADRLLADACAQSANIITAVNIVNETVIEPDKETDKLVENPLHIALIEKPYNALLANTTIGFANTLPDNDSYIRRSILQRTDGTETIDSLSYSIYKKYCATKGITPSSPDLGTYGEFSFSYTGKPGSYETVSLVDVLNETVDPRTFRDCIVLIGAHAPGMQDAYNTPIDRSTQMYGVEIHANIIQALLNNRTYSPIPSVFAGLIVGFFAAIYYLCLKKLRFILGAIIGVGLILLEFGAGLFLLPLGYELPLLTLPVFLAATYVYQLVRGYVEERLNRKHVVDAFKKYVAPQVVEKLVKKGEYQITLDGENRNIAVLFVDIRGFTTMSESLEPEQVVDILNEYLSLTTSAIFQNEGTLDKFIGDATMAIFNAPFDLADYTYKAVCTARDIAAGAKDLEIKFKERYGKSVRFGIGVNMGPAVVGNIGCDVRMDYTAIGDTVNTAARLESNAKSGQILISESVYNALNGRIEATEIGEIPLKGKNRGIMVYQLDKIL